MEKINIAELLKDCPKGMELDCTMFDNVTFEGLDPDDYPIKIKVGDDRCMYLTENGCWDKSDNAKCIIFPKGKNTWEGFQKPFKDGDIIYVKDKYNQEWCSILSNYVDNKLYTYIDFYINYSIFYYNKPNILCEHKYIIEYRLATEEETQKLFKAIKDNGYQWNAETKTLEKLFKPKFKVGDRIKCIYFDRKVAKVVKIHDKRYELDDEKFLEFQDENAYEISCDKFDIATLKPFDKVLVRSNNGKKWTIDFFGVIDNYNKYPFICLGRSITQCIPYEGNQHLLNTTDDCDEYYKTWK